MDRGLLDDDGHSDNLSNRSELASPLMVGTQIDLVSQADADDCISSKDQQDTIQSFSPISQRSYVNEDRVERDCVGAASSAPEAGGEGESDTVEDIMNMPYTIFASAPVQNFSSLCPNDKSVPDDAGQMRTYRERIQAKLKKQVLAQESEYSTATLTKFTELYTPQHRDRDDESIDGTDFLNGPDESFWTSLSSIELTSDPGTTFQAPKDLPFVTTPSRKSTRSSRSSESKATTPFKRRRKASSLDELAALARIAAIEETEAEEEAALKELEKYREMDLAPLEPIMKSKTAGDVIMHGTPVKAQNTEIFGSRYRTLKYRTPQTLSGGQKRKRGVRLQLQTPTRCSVPLLGQEEGHSKDTKTPEACFPTSDQHHAVPHANHPTFITVIEMLPATVFWCTAAAIMRCSLKVLDALIERLTGLRVQDTQTSE